MTTHPAPSPQALRQLALVLVVGAASLGTTAGLATLVGARFSFWLNHTGLVLTLALGHTLVLGLLWDGAALFASRVIPGRQGLWRRVGFFSLGGWPLLLLAAAVYFVAETANITLISLTLLESTTTWRDAFFWRLEEPLVRWVTALRPDVRGWEALYHSAWTIELSAVFLLFVIGRRAELLSRFVLSFLLVFYAGRLIGLVTPVMGPALYRPDLFPYLEDTFSARAMQAIVDLIGAGAGSVRPDALLLGGVSAMPSLHIAMVGLTAYWLWAGKRATAWVTLPWVLAVWTSTVVLGWHYALDGVGGLLLAGAAIAATHRLMAWWGRGEGREAA